MNQISNYLAILGDLAANWLEDEL